MSDPVAAAARRVTALALKTSLAYKLWLRDVTDAAAVSPARLVRKLLEEWALSLGHPAPPEAVPSRRGRYGQPEHEPEVEAEAVEGEAETEAEVDADVDAEVEPDAPSVDAEARPDAPSVDAEVEPDAPSVDAEVEPDAPSPEPSPRPEPRPEASPEASPVSSPSPVSEGSPSPSPAPAANASDHSPSPVLSSSLADWPHLFDLDLAPRIVELFSRGIPPRDITRQLNCDMNTVIRTLARRAAANAAARPQ